MALCHHFLLQPLRPQQTIPGQETPRISHLDPRKYFLTLQENCICSLVQTETWKTCLFERAALFFSDSQKNKCVVVSPGQSCTFCLGTEPCFPEHSHIAISPTLADNKPPGTIVNSKSVFSSVVVFTDTKFLFGDPPPLPIPDEFVEERAPRPIVNSKSR